MNDSVSKPNVVLAYKAAGIAAVAATVITAAVIYFMGAEDRRLRHESVQLATRLSTEKSALEKKVARLEGDLEATRLELQYQSALAAKLRGFCGDACKGVE